MFLFSWHIFDCCLLSVDPLQFPKKVIPSHMSIHPVLHTFSSLWFQEQWLDTKPSFTQQDICNTLQDQGLGSMISQIPGIRTPSPPIWQLQSVWQSKGFFPVGSFLGVICNIQEEGCHMMCVSLTQTYSISSERCIFQDCVCLWHHHLCNFIAEWSSIVYRDSCFLIQSSLHRQKMVFHALLLCSVLPECSGVFKFWKRILFWRQGYEW